MTPLILIGGGGHCRACIDVIDLDGRFQIVGIIDVQPRVGEKVLGYPIIGTDAELSGLKEISEHCLITLGQVGLSDKREDLFKRARQLDFKLPVIISPRAHVAASATIGYGTIVMHDALVNAGAVVGKNCIINSKTLIEHDAHIGNHTHIATGCIVNGDAVIGDRSFVGSGAVIFESRRVGHAAAVGGGQVVRQDLPDNYSPVPRTKR